MRFRDRVVTVRAGEMIVVPAGVEHCPYAADECQVLLVEPGSTKHTGNVEHDRTIHVQTHI